MNTDQQVNRTIKELIATGKIELIEAVCDERGEYGTLKVHGSWVTISIAWSDQTWEFKVTGTQYASGFSAGNNCSFSYNSDLGETLTQRMAEAI